MADTSENMDEVLDKLGSTLISQNLLDSEDNKGTNFEGLYKNWGKLGSQEERRKEILQVQKSNRNDKLDRFRGIFELVKAVEERDLFQTRASYYRPTIYVAGFNKAANYSDVLMMSEWMLEKPEDFVDNWFVVPCPKGVRMLVVASNGTTKFYTKFGHFRTAQRTALPGGSGSDRRSKSRCCILDGFYLKQTNTFFILDILAWNDQPMTDGETEFRHYWLVSQLGEISALKTVSKNNEVKFTILPKTPCDNESFSKFMMKFPHFEENIPMMDGLLFYHKKAHYFSGETPLVGWLYPYMVPEVIGAEIQINKAYELEKPEDYVNQTDFIMKFEAKIEKKKKRNRKNRTNSEMDTSDAQSEKAGESEKSQEKSKENDGMETESTEVKKSEKSETTSTMDTETDKEKNECKK